MWPRTVVRASLSLRSREAHSRVASMAEAVALHPPPITLGFDLERGASD